MAKRAGEAGKAAAAARRQHSTALMLGALALIVALTALTVAMIAYRDGNGEPQSPTAQPQTNPQPAQVNATPTEDTRAQTQSEPRATDTSSHASTESTESIDTDKSDPSPLDFGINSQRDETDAPQSTSASAAPFQPAAPYTVPAGHSPIPQPGEVFADGPIPAKRLAPPREPRTSDPPKAGELVPWGQAHQHVGRRITVKGEIVNTHNTGTVCFLNFTHNWRDRFYIIVFEDAFTGVPGGDPATHYRDKMVHVTGVVKTHKGRPQIRVSDARQIEVVEQ